MMSWAEAAGAPQEPKKWGQEDPISPTQSPIDFSEEEK
jgi:hypothetical protein